MDDSAAVGGIERVRDLDAVLQQGRVLDRLAADLLV